MTINRNINWDRYFTREPQIKRPNFFLVGAPKCGTTALHKYLSNHQDIFMAKKERHYFGSDLRYPGYSGLRCDPNWYVDCFADQRGESRVGEASVWYLYSQVAAREIREFNPNADIIVMLRDPVEMLYSLYHMFIWVKDLSPGGVIDAKSKKVLSFEDAISGEQERKRQFVALTNDPSTNYNSEIERRLFHSEVAMYSQQVKRYIDLFGRDRVHFVIYDDFKRNTQDAVDAVLSTLGVESESQNTYDVVNSNRNIRFSWLHYTLKTHDSLGILRRSGRVLVPVKIRKRIHRSLMEFNVKRQERLPMRPETRQYLRKKYQVDIDTLSSLIDRDLTRIWQ